METLSTSWSLSITSKTQISPICREFCLANARHPPQNLFLWGQVEFIDQILFDTWSFTIFLPFFICVFFATHCGISCTKFAIISRNGIDDHYWRIRERHTSTSIRLIFLYLSSKSNEFIDLMKFNEFLKVKIPNMDTYAKALTISKKNGNSSGRQNLVNR